MILVLKSNKLRDIKSSFIHAIGGYYDEKEAVQIFQLIVEAYLNLSKLEMLVDPERKLSESEILIFEKAAIRLNNYEPIQYILGHTNFDGCKIYVNEHVLIPRPETEELVNWIKSELTASPKRILDIGSGSGCIAIALSKYFEMGDVWGMEISQDAIDISARSGLENRATVNWVKDDIFRASSDYPQFDLIVSNPPYVELSRKEILAKHVSNMEPDLALFVPSNNPMQYYSAIASFASTHLIESGFLYVEINEEYGKITTDLFKTHGFKVQLKQDLSGKDRFLKCWKPA